MNTGRSGLASANSNEKQQIDLWPWLLAAALLGLLGEAVLAWRR